MTDVLNERKKSGHSDQAKSQRTDGHLQAKEIGLRRNQLSHNEKKKKM